MAGHTGLMFWVTSAAFALMYLTAVATVVGRWGEIVAAPGPLLRAVGLVLLLAPASWVAFFQVHRGLRRLNGQLADQPEARASIWRAHAGVTAFALVAYMTLGASLRLARHMLDSLPR